jgi:ankyrin repeat protein
VAQLFSLGRNTHIKPQTKDKQMKQIPIIALTISLALLTGCVSSPPTMQSAVNVPAVRQSEDRSLAGASERGDAERLNFLLSEGVDAKGQDGATALLIAIREIAFKELAQDWSVHGISPDRRLVYVKIVKALLEAGANPNTMKYHGYFNTRGGTQQQVTGGVVDRTTSFVLAGMKGEIVEAAAGDLSALGLAQQEGLTDIIPLLQQAGAR